MEDTFTGSHFFLWRNALTFPISDFFHMPKKLYMYRNYCFYTCHEQFLKKIWYSFPWLFPDWPKFPDFFLTDQNFLTFTWLSGKNFSHFPCFPVLVETCTWPISFLGKLCLDIINAQFIQKLAKNLIRANNATHSVNIAMQIKTGVFVAFLFHPSV